LIRAHSTRRHRATLMHYISANGVEGYRQKTPVNIVPIAQLLLQSGADVNASADIYGGSTTLALVATGLHPERAGVQDALLQLLLDYGAKVDLPNQPAGQILTACLANGRFHAAEFLAQHGAELNLEAAAGLGRLDVVKSFFEENGNLKPSATKAQRDRALLWSCEYGHNEVAEFLIKSGVPLETQADTGQTALHWAVIGGHLNTIKLLLDRGAPLEAKNSYGATPLGQALWSALQADGRIDYFPAIETLLKAGAKIEDGTLSWITQPPASSLIRQRIAKVLERHGLKS
jgi:ankyrin repeat protein